jgi:hypothetical protein
MTIELTDQQKLAVRDGGLLGDERRVEAALGS